MIHQSLGMFLKGSIQLHTVADLASASRSLTLFEAVYLGLFSAQSAISGGCRSRSGISIADLA